jgi:hypothetical protein
MWAEEKAGRPKLIFYGCFPEAHPSWMLVTHNAMEILFTPGWAPAHVAIPNPKTRAAGRLLLPTSVRP